MELLVVGAGEMGRWVADTVTASAGTPGASSGDDGAVRGDNGAVRGNDGADIEVAFVDVDRDRARDAASKRAARSIPPNPSGTFDVVCLAVPISAVERAVESYADTVTGAMVDVSGVMTEPLEAMATHLPADVERASLHPLFAPPRVPGNVAAVVEEDGPFVADIVDAIEAGGNDVFETTAAEHDAAMETVQAGAHTAILAWRLAGDAVREEFHTPVSAALEELADTVTEGDPSVYAEIQHAFDGADDVAGAARDIAEADFSAFADLYEMARADRGGRDRLE